MLITGVCSLALQDWQQFGQKITLEKPFSLLLKRRETYGTSGNKILLRFFAGYDLEQGDLNSKDPISIFYKKGVPMGSDLIQKKEAQPIFVAWAQKDKNGAPLQRIQIIKGWYDDS